MPKMCQLPLNAKGDLIYVNPTNVLYVRAGSPGNSLVFFDTMQSIGVAADVQSLVHALDVAMNSDGIREASPPQSTPASSDR